MDPASKFRTSRMEISIPFNYKKDSLRLKISIPNDSNNIESRVYFSVFNSTHPNTPVSEIPFKIKKILKSKETKKILDQQLIDKILQAKNNIHKIAVPGSKSDNVYKLLPIPSMSPPLSRRFSYDPIGSKPAQLKKSVSFSGENEIMTTRISEEFDEDDSSRPIIKEFLVISVIEFTDAENEILGSILKKYSEFNKFQIKEFIKQDFFPPWLLDCAKEKLLKKHSNIIDKIIHKNLTHQLHQLYTSEKLSQFSFYNTFPQNSLLQFVTDMVSVEVIITYLYVDFMEFCLKEFFKTIPFDVPLNDIYVLFSNRISSFLSGESLDLSVISFIQTRLSLLKTCNSIDDDEDQILEKFIELNPNPEPYVDVLKLVISKIKTELPKKLMIECIDFIRYLKKKQMHL